MTELEPPEVIDGVAVLGRWEDAAIGLALDESASVELASLSEFPGPGAKPSILQDTRLLLYGSVGSRWEARAAFLVAPARFVADDSQPGGSVLQRLWFRRPGLDRVTAWRLLWVLTELLHAPTDHLVAIAPAVCPAFGFPPDEPAERHRVWVQSQLPFHLEAEPSVYSDAWESYRLLGVPVPPLEPGREVLLASLGLPNRPPPARRRAWRWNGLAFVLAEW